MHIILIQQESTARPTCKALKSVHESINLCSKLHLLRKLSGTKLKEEGNITNHIIKILETADKIKAAGEEIKYSHLSALLLFSLPPSYDILMTAVAARPEDELISEFIQLKLIDNISEERRKLLIVIRECT